MARLKGSRRPVIALVVFLISTIALEVSIALSGSWGDWGALGATLGTIVLQVVVVRFCWSSEPAYRDEIAGLSRHAADAYRGLVVAGLLLNSVVALAAAYALQAK